MVNFNSNPKPTSEKKTRNTNSVTTQEKHKRCRKKPHKLQGMFKSMTVTKCRFKAMTLRKISNPEVLMLQSHLMSTNSQTTKKLRNRQPVKEKFKKKKTNLKRTNKKS